MATQTSLAPTAPQTPSQVRRTIADLLQSDDLKAAVKAALPRHLKVDRFIRVALNSTMRTPDLLECTRESFFRCLLDLSALGLEADGRRAHLIPFNNKIKGQNGSPDRWVKEVQLIVDYKGLAELVRRSGDVSYIHADVVYEHDEWDYAFGSGAFLKHRPNLDDRGNKVIAVYSFVKLRDGSEDFIVLSRSDVEKVRQRAKSPNSPAWVNNWDEMAKKTAFRRHSKWLPLSPESRDAIEHDDEYTGGDMADALGAAAHEAHQILEHHGVDAIPGTKTAAEAIAEAKIAQMEAAEAERAKGGLLPGETPEDREKRQAEQFARELEAAKARENQQTKIKDLPQWPDDPYASELGTEVRVDGKWYRRPTADSDEWREVSAARQETLAGVSAGEPAAAPAKREAPKFGRR